MASDETLPPSPTPDHRLNDRWPTDGRPDDGRPTDGQPNDGQLFGATGTPTAPTPRGPGARAGRRRNLALVAAIFLLVGSILVGFGARDGWFAGDSSSASNAAVDAPNSSSNRTSTVDNSDNSGVDLGDVADDVQPAIVNITSATDTGGGAGTGLIISSKGLVLTNHHVISGARKLQVELASTGDTYDAHVVGYGLDDDVALVQIEGASGLPTISPESDVRADDSVLVMGNALGRGGESTVSAGTVVALGQQITATDETGAGAETLTDMIQISASVQPGQSGGAVVNADGEVVGMTTAASSNGGFRLGFDEGSAEAFAIPIERALAAADEIEGGESTDSVHVGPRAVLGVEIQAQLVAPNGGQSPFDNGSGSTSGAGSDDGGVLVSGLDANGPAAAAGITEGSTIVGIGDETVQSADEITAAMNRLKPDDEVKVTWLTASGERQTALVKLIEGPPL